MADEARKEHIEQSRSAGEGRSKGSNPPWETPLDGLVLLTLDLSGKDPAMDRLLGLSALRIDQGGVSEEWQLEAGEGENGSPAAEALWTELGDFVGDRLLLVPDASELRNWLAAGGVDPSLFERVTGLNEAAGLLMPGRLATRPDSLVAELGEASSDPGGPAQLRDALGELVRRFSALGQDCVHAISVSLATAWSRLFVTEPEAADRIARVLGLLQASELWGTEAESSADQATLRFESDALETEFLALVLADARPRWEIQADEWRGFDPLPPHRESALPFTTGDEALLDVLFREHLPRLFAEERGETGASDYRESQHSVSREVARNFGHQTLPETQLLLVHAPTGTGKTLAYLVPALLWSLQHSVRVGVSTYTRALQEQAIDREVPRALELLKRSGRGHNARVSMLKGRENYLCWRTFKLHIPAFEANGEQWLAFSQLLAFSMTDSSGDLDRLPRRPPIELEHNKTYRSTLTDLMRQVRARTSCCRAKQDKSSCGAEVARWRAERSHLVVTNHSFALARQEFFRHLIFDECEHLHDQAHSAWSHSVGFGEITSLLDRLYNPAQSRSRSLFIRIAKRLVQGTPSWEVLEDSRIVLEDLRFAFEELRHEAGVFDTWRKGRARERDEREVHSLLREYVESDLGRKLIVKRLMFCQSGNKLDEGLSELSERLEKLGKGRMARIRRTIDLARTELVEFIDAISAWLPIQEGRPCFNSRTFNDVEVDARGELQLAARVLLPNEFLGRYYYPQLSTATFLSATTFMQGGFDAAISYLGLDRSLLVAEDEPNHLCTLRTFRAPEVFDYGRVLVSIPRDAPSVSRDKETFLRYVRDFIAELGEKTSGRMLVLFTNADDVRQVGAQLEGHFRARGVGLWYQNMPGISKEELSELFRDRQDSVLLGVDTFWYGADFPGETLEHLVIVRLPYGVPDRYHHAQCAALGAAEQRRQIYMPRALAKFRQGFGRLMRRVDDRGCVYLLDHRIVDPRHRSFLRELPVSRVGEEGQGLARLVRGDTQRCLSQAMIHMGLEEAARPLEVSGSEDPAIERFEPDHEQDTEAACEPIDINTEDLPF